MPDAWWLIRRHRRVEWGGIYNTLTPSLTLGCGSGGKNITTENISAKHLINIKKVCRRRDNVRLAKFDVAKYLDEKYDLAMILKEYNKNY